MTSRGRADALRRLLTWPPTSRREIFCLQGARLRRLVAHAYRHVPVVGRRLRGARLTPDDVRGLRDLSRIPVTEKRDLLHLPAEDLVAKGLDPGRLPAHRTSGSTGQPFTVRATRFEESLFSAHRLRVMRRWGVRLTDRVLNLAHVSLGHRAPAALRITGRVGLLRFGVVSSLLPEPELIGAMRAFRPDVIRSHASAAAHLATELSEADRRLIRPRLVIVGSETLTPLMRSQIEEGFRARVRLVYGAREFKWMAWECPETGLLHVCDDGMILEVCRDGEHVGPGETGEVIGTALHSYAQPFLRYRLNDMVTRGPTPCPCGLPFSTLVRVEGRKSDWIVLPGRGAVPPQRLFIPLLSGAPWIKQYQLVQDRLDHVVFRIVPRHPPDREMLGRLEERMREVFGDGIEAEVEVADRIEISSGTFRISRSEVRSHYDAGPAPSGDDTTRRE